MSEYQYYEFQAVDRPLSDEEMRELRAVSSRAEITPTRFVNEYNWGDFRGKPDRWMERYFDAFLYLANWGSRELMLRFPADALDADAARRYCVGRGASVRVHDGFVILSFTSDEEDGDSWDANGSGWLSSIITLREEIAGGDHRALYLAWLLCVQDGYLEDDEPEPPVPPGLATPSGALEAFRRFLRIDADLVQVAAERSPAALAPPDAEEVRRWIASLAEDEWVELLARVAAGQERQVRGELLRRAHAARTPPPAATSEPRTVGELLEAADRIADERSRRESEAAARERARRERELAEARQRHLDRLVGRQEELWSNAGDLVASRKPKSYDEAVALLVDLRDLAARDGAEPAFRERIDALREQHASKSSFLQRLHKAIG